MKTVLMTLALIFLVGCASLTPLEQKMMSCQGLSFKSTDLSNRTEELRKLRAGPLSDRAMAESLKDEGTLACYKLKVVEEQLELERQNARSQSLGATGSYLGGFGIFMNALQQ